MTQIDRPGPGEELNDGAATVPRPAATIVLLRGGSEVLELLMVRRTPEARFMGGVWVFPGGAVDRHEGDGEAAARVAAVREMVEEAGIAIADPASLVSWSRWVTPAELKVRFDTWFFLAPAPEGAEPQIDGQEAVDARWFTPQGALAAHRDGEIDLVFPTIKTLEQLERFTTADELLEFARGRDVSPIEPRVVGSPESARIVLPGEPGYEEVQ